MLMNIFGFLDTDIGDNGGEDLMKGQQSFDVARLWQKTHVDMTMTSAVLSSSVIGDLIPKMLDVPNKLALMSYQALRTFCSLYTVYKKTKLNYS